MYIIKSVKVKMTCLAEHTNLHIHKYLDTAPIPCLRIFMNTCIHADYEQCILVYRIAHSDEIEAVLYRTRMNWHYVTYRTCILRDFFSSTCTYIVKFVCETPALPQFTTLAS